MIIITDSFTGTLKIGILKIFIYRSLRGDKLLFAITRLGRSSVWCVSGSALSVSSVGSKMGLWRHRVSTCWLLGSHTLGGISIYLHVDLRGSLSGYQVNHNYI